MLQVRRRQRDLVVGEWVVDTARSSLRCGRREIRLEPLVLQLLTVLAHRAGEVVSAEELRRTVWEGRFLDTRTVAKRVAELRSALGDRASDPSYIATVPRRGYVLVAPVARRNGRPRFTLAACGLAAAFLVVALLVVAVREPATPAPGSLSDLVQRGRSALASGSSQGRHTAVTLLERAVAGAPDRLDARVALLEAYSVGAMSSARHEAWRQAAARQAAVIEADGGGGSGAQRALGLAAAAVFDVDQALSAQRRAFADDPADLTAAFGLTEALQHRGRWFDAISVLGEMLEQDPGSVRAAFEMAELLRRLGFDDAASAWFRHGARLAPYDTRAQIRWAVLDLAEGRLEECRQRVLRLLEIDPNCVPCLQVLGEVHLRSGEPARATQLLTRVPLEAPDPSRAFARLRLATLAGDHAAVDALIEEWGGGFGATDSSWFTPWLLARAHAALGKPDDSLGQLRLAADRGYLDWQLDLSEPLFTIFTDDPRFDEILARQRQRIAGMRSLVESSGLVAPPASTAF